MRTRIDPVAVANNSNPEPWLTPRFTNAGCFATEKKLPTKEALTATVELLSTMANALSTDDKVYSVGYADNEIAATTFSGRIGVGIGSLVDPTLTEGQRAALLTGAMVHEVGHINNLRLWVDQVGAAFGIPKGVSTSGAVGFQPTARQLMALRVLNVASDIHDEEMQRQRYVGFADTLDVLIWYAAGGHRMTNGTLKITGPRLDGSHDERFNEALSAARFPWCRDWTQTTEATEWLTWWDQWAEAAADCRTATEMIRLTTEGVDKIMAATTSPDPVTPKGDDPGTEPGGEDDDDTTCGPTGPGGDKPKPKADPKGDDTDDGQGGDAEGDDADEPKGSEDDPKGQPKGGGQTTDPVDPTEGDDDDDNEPPPPGRGPGGTSTLKDVADLKLPECPVDALHQDKDDERQADQQVAATQRSRRSGFKKRDYVVTVGGKTVTHHVFDETPKA